MVFEVVVVVVVDDDDVDVVVDVVVVVAAVVVVAEITPGWLPRWRLISLETSSSLMGLVESIRAKDLFPMDARRMVGLAGVIVAASGGVCCGVGRASMTLACGGRGAVVVEVAVVETGVVAAVEGVGRMALDWMDSTWGETAEGICSNGTPS